MYELPVKFRWPVLVKQNFAAPLREISQTLFFMKKTLLLLSAVAVTAGASAQISKSNGSGQISVTNSTLTYTQDFNTLDTSSAIADVSSNVPNGWYITEVGTGTSVDGKYRGGTGTSNTGNLFSLGSTGNTDRALGSLASSSLASPMFGAQFVNNTGGSITGVTFSLKMEQWRVGDTSSRIDTTMFSMSMTADSLSDTMATAMWVDVPTLMLTSIITVPASGTNSALDGNQAANSRTITGSLSSINIPNGAKLWIRWKDKDMLGSDDALAIDDMSITFTTASSVNNVTTNNLPLSLLGNGTGNDVKATFTAPENGAYTVTVTDLAGRVISTQEGTSAKGQIIVAPVTNQTLASGLYLVRIAQGTFSGVEKLSVR